MMKNGLESLRFTFINHFPRPDNYHPNNYEQVYADCNSCHARVNGGDF